MTTETNDTTTPVTSQAPEQIVADAMTQIGRAINSRRTLLGLRQSDIEERTSIAASRVSRIEAAKLDTRLSTLILILDSVGMLDDVLEAFSVVMSNDMKKRVMQSEGLADRATKPLTTNQFLALYDHDPLVEAPVATRASLELRRRGFAIRRVSHPILGPINYATAVDNAMYSEETYHTETGTIGGFRYIQVEAAGQCLTDEQNDAAPLLLGKIRALINEAIVGYQIRVNEIALNESATAHLVTLNDEPIESVFIYDKICDVINNGEWLAHE